MGTVAGGATQGPGRADVVVVGTGAAGLSLALHLARGGALFPGRRVVLLGPGRDVLHGPGTLHGHGTAGTDPFGSRVWGFWDTARCPVLPRAGTSFPVLRLHAGGRSLRLPSAPYRYRVVRGSDLRSLTAAALAGRPEVEHLPFRARAIVDGPDGALVEHDGGVLSTRWVLDSAGLWAAPARPAAVMAFRGWEVVTDRRRLDEQVPTLFDFRGLPAGSFGYQVPLGPGRALVEVTRIVPPDGTGLPDPEPYLREVMGLEGYEIRRTEEGRLPLTPWHPRPAGRHVLAVGLPAGMLKASSGFGLARIQRDSAAVASSLLRHGHPFALPVPRWRHGLFDATFLRAVLRDPPLLERAFGVLGRRPARLMRFLDEDCTLRQEVGIALGMPPAGFLRGGCEALLGAARPRRQAAPARRPGREGTGETRREGPAGPEGLAVPGTCAGKSGWPRP